MDLGLGSQSLMSSDVSLLCSSTPSLRFTSSALSWGEWMLLVAQLESFWRDVEKLTLVVVVCVWVVSASYLLTIVVV